MTEVSPLPPAAYSVRLSMVERQEPVVFRLVSNIPLSLAPPLVTMTSEVPK